MSRQKTEARLMVLFIPLEGRAGRFRRSLPCPFSPFSHPAPPPVTRSARGDESRTRTPRSPPASAVPGAGLREDRRHMRLRRRRATDSRPAISALVSPAAISRSTSASRSVSRATHAGAPAAPARGVLGGQRAHRRRVEERVAARRRRTACTSSSAAARFSRNPAAPACRASYTYASFSKVVTTSDPRQGHSRMERICSVARMPSISGIRTSINTTSGRSSAPRRRPPRRWSPPRRPRCPPRRQDHPQCRAHHPLVVREHHPHRSPLIAAPPPGRPSPSLPPSSAAAGR